MTARVARPWPWRVHLALSLAVALGVHLLAIWAAPRLIMVQAMRRIEAGGAGINRVFHAPAVDARSRTIVMPSPDMLYSLCLLDLSRGPVRVRADARLAGYWSVAVYAANSDNVFVRNDRQLQGKGLDLWLSPPGQHARDVPGGALRLAMPSERGIVLMRVLTAVPSGQPASLEDARAVLERERQTLRCQPSHETSP